jgi:outer membrane protein assembly factor BamA
LYVEAESVPSICVYSLPAGRVERRCDFTGGVSHLSVSRDDRRLAFACYTNVGWDIAVLEEPLDSIPADTGVRAGGPAETAVFEKVGLDFGQVRAAPFRLSVDYAAGAASYSGAGGSGLAGTLNVAFSDMLGNHRFEVYTDLYGNILSSNGLVQYWLLPYRADFGFALFQYREYPYYNPYLRIVERLNRGGQATAALPFNRFFRVEAGLTAYAGEVTQWTPDYSRPDGWLKRQWWERTFSVSGATVFDNTLWTEQGPTRGTRIRVEAGSSFLSDSLYQLAYADLRDYQRIGRRFVFASRLLAAGSFGDADRFYLGGEDIRGYNWGEFYDRQGTGLGLFSLEFRYPFIDRLKLAFPLPLDIRGVRGVAFLDGGLVLGDSMKFWDVATGRPHDLKLGAGAGLRIQVSVLYLKLDFARPLSATDDDSWKFIFGLGSDF